MRITLNSTEHIKQAFTSNDVIKSIQTFNNNIRIYVLLILLFRIIEIRIRKENKCTNCLL